MPLWYTAIGAPRVGLGETLRTRHAYWMRESAHRADSEISGSGDAASSLRRAQMRACCGVPGAGSELPRAMQALRTRPRHFARFMGLPRKVSRNCSSLIAASHSSRGRKRDSSSSSFAAAEEVASLDGSSTG
jgi:hypothetical protein